MLAAVPRSLTAPRALLVALLAAASLAGFAATAGDARAARGLELAIQDDAVFVGQSYYNREKAYKNLRALGVTRLRINVLWAWAMPNSQSSARRKPSQIHYQWGTLDDAIDAAARHGVRVHLSLTGPAPRWATGNRKRISGYKPKAKEFRGFVRAAAQHFKGRVDRYSIWNEPNWKSWLGPIKSQASLYRSLYRAGYEEIKKADRRAKVLIAETSPNGQPGRSQSPLTFLRKLTCVNSQYRRAKKCPTLKADGYAHHPYDFRHAPTYAGRRADDVTMGGLGKLTRALDRLKRAKRLVPARGGRMPVFLTEFGYFSSGHRAIKKSLRTRYIKQAYSMALRNGRVKSQLQYLLAAPPRRSQSAFFNTALLTTKGKAYPTYNALRSWYRANRGKVKRPGSAINLPPAP